MKLPFLFFTFTAAVLSLKLSDIGNPERCDFGVFPMNGYTWTRHTVDNDFFENVLTVDYMRSLKTLRLEFCRIRLIGSGMFMNFDNLTILRLWYNGITHIHPNAFDNLVNLQQLNLEDSAIKSIPQELFYSLINIKEITISATQLKTLDVRFSNGSQMEKLVLFGNYQLTAIEPTTFNGLWCLKYLTLRWNPITKINDSLFYDLKNITEIYISYSWLKTFDVRFRNGTKLEQLALVKNKELVSIEPESLKGLWHLRRLNLYKCGITTIQNDLFYDLKNIEVIDLRNNKLKRFDVRFPIGTTLKELNLNGNSELRYIGPDSLKGLWKHTTLDLSGYRLDTIPNKLFYDLKNLEHLDLSDNNIQRFDVKFHNGTTLKEIKLTGNSRLSYIGPDSLTGLWNHTTLDLSGYRLNTIPNKLFYDLKNLEHLDLSNNDIQRFNVKFHNGTTLKELKLTGNSRLSYIGPDSLKGLWNHTTLDLSGYRLNTIPNKLFYDLKNLEHLDLSNNDIQRFDVKFHNGTTLKELKLTGNSRLSYIGPDSLTGLWNHTTLDLSGYRLYEIPRELFYDLTNLVDLDLSNNDLQRFDVNFQSGNRLEKLILSGNKNMTSMGDDTLKGLTSLKILDLSFCGLTSIPKYLFYDLLKLESLNLRGNDLKTFDMRFQQGAMLMRLDLVMESLENMNPESFRSLDNLITIHTSEFWLCCAQNVGEKNQKKCKPEKFSLSSCDDLMKYKGLRIFVWIMGFAATMGNLTVITYRLLLKDERKTTYKTFVGHLSVSDLMMGVYLLIIASVDERYRNVYGPNKREWMQSLLCKICGFLSTMSSETSAIFIFLITLDRFLVTKFPFGGVRFDRITTHVSCSIAWITGFGLALVPFLPVPPFQEWEMYSSNDMCVGLPLSVTRPPGWGYSVAIFVGLNFLLFLLIAFGQIAICWTFVRNRPNVSSPTFERRRRQQEIAVARSLSLIVVSDFLCWFPIGVLGFLTAFGVHVGSEGYIWTAAVVLPINSALNPVLYTLGGMMGNVRDRWLTWQTARARRTEFELSRRNERCNGKDGKGTSITKM